MATGGPRPPRQARSRRTLRNLEQAARELVARNGAETVTVADVVARARSSVGSFYARFAGKEEFFAHLSRQGWQEALESWQEAGVDRAGSPEEVVRALAVFLVEMERRDGNLRRSLASVTPPIDGAADFRRAVARSLAGPLGLSGRGEARIAMALEVGLSVLDVLGRQEPAGEDGAGDPAKSAGVLVDLTAVLGCLLLRPSHAGAATPAEEERQEERREAVSPLPDKESPESDTVPVDPFDVWG